jgi:hypothetical protein
MDLVEKHVIEAALEFYDNSSNGNRKIGKMKKASDAYEILSCHKLELIANTHQSCNATGLRFSVR